MNRMSHGLKWLFTASLICVCAMVSQVAFADLSGPGAPPPPPPGSKG